MVAGAVRLRHGKSVRTEGGGSSMEHLFSALAFAGLMGGQFLAVVFVAHEHSKIRSSERCVSRDEDPRTRNIWLFSE